MNGRIALWTANTSLLALLIAASAITPTRGSAAAVHPKHPDSLVASPAMATGQPPYAMSVKPLVAKYCVGCHSGGQPSGGIDLAAFQDDASVIRASATWQKVADNVSTAHMPPAGMPQPTTEERARIVDWVQATISQAGCNLKDPGRVTLHRLNRAEYDNTVDDLLHVDLRPSSEFPSDDVGYGFDNNGDVLSMSPLLLEKYLNAAEDLAHTAIVAPESRDKVVRFTGSDLKSATLTQSLTPSGSDILYSNGEAGVKYAFPEAGNYVVRIRAYGQQAGPDPCRMSIRLDGQDQLTSDVPQVAAKPGTFTATVHVEAGEHSVGAAFLNDYYKPDDPNPNNRDRNLVVDRIAIEGPVGIPAQPPLSERLLVTRWPKSRAEYDACARANLAPFATRAFRRPVTARELNGLVGCFHAACANGSSFQRGMQVAVEAVLVSPSFLFRAELDPGAVGSGKAAHPLSSYEMASRLSYFLWSTMPDDTLMRLAAQNRLQDPAVLKAQVARMLKDPKAKALSTNFADQWLELRKLAAVAPDKSRFPEYDGDLRDSMRAESEMYFQNVVAQDRSILEFLDSNYTFVNEPLAKLYGIPGVTGKQMRLVHLADHVRGGVLTQASVLTVTSNPTRTSPVKRGKWVLEQLLGTPPPPPPPGVPQLDDKSHGPLTGTLRERMIQHRSNPACAACHGGMDPLGFGLENFDAVGAWRLKDGDAPVDASGTLPDGSKFDGPAQLKTILMKRKGQFVHAFSEKMLTYALGRGLETSDRCYVDKIAAATTSDNYKMSALITAVVQSTPFRKRMAEGK